MSGTSERELRQAREENSGWRGFLRSVFGGSSSTSKRKHSVDVGVGDWYEKPLYQKSSLTNMVKDIPDIRGAITTQVNAAIGNWKFTTAIPQDDETTNPMILNMSKWAELPERNFELFLRKAAFSLLMRGIVFVELSKDTGKEPWMYVMNPLNCKFKYNESQTRITGLLVQNPNKVDSKPLDWNTDKFVYNSMDNFDGEDIPSPPLETLLDDANLYAAGMAYLRNMYKSGGLGRMAFIMEEGSEDDYEAMKADIKSRKGQSVAIKGKIKIQPLSLSPKDMMHESLYDDFVEKIMTLYSVPPIMMSKPNATYKETSKSEMNAFASKVRALQRCLQNLVDQAVLKLHDEKAGSIRFKLEPWVDPATQAAINEVLTRIGSTHPNEIRYELGRPPYDEDWANLPYNFNFPPQRMEMEQQAQQEGGDKPKTGGKQEGSEDKDDVDKVKRVMSIMTDLSDYVEELVESERAYREPSASETS